MSKSQFSQGRRVKFQRRFKMKAEDGNDGMKMAKKVSIWLGVVSAYLVITLCKVVKGTSEVGRYLTELKH